MTRHAVLFGGPCDGTERIIDADVLVIPLMPELPGTFDPELGGWHVTADEALQPLPPFQQARYRVTDELRDGMVIYRYEGSA